MPVDAGLIPGAVQAAIGVGQSIAGGIQAHRAQRQLEKLISGYQPNQSIMDFYSKALQRYNVNPYQSNVYQMQKQNAGRGLTTGISALHDRRSATGNIATLVQGYNDANLKAAATAEGQQAQALGQLGQATGMKAAEDKYKFEAKYNLLSAKAGGGNQILNSGIQNAYGGAGSISNYLTAKDMYGNNDYGTAGGRRG